MFKSSGFRLPQSQVSHDTQLEAAVRRGRRADRPLPLVTQKPAQQRLAGRLALAAFVKRPQADVQIGAGRDLTNILALLKSISRNIISIFDFLWHYLSFVKDKLLRPKR
jgi:hypothetical protein